MGKPYIIIGLLQGDDRPNWCAGFDALPNGLVVIARLGIGSLTRVSAFMRWLVDTQ